VKSKNDEADDTETRKEEDNKEEAEGDEE